MTDLTGSNVADIEITVADLIGINI